MNSSESSISEQLRQAYAERDAELREHFQRSLPLQDAMMDRWERAQRLGFDEGASIYNSAIVFGDVNVGEQTWVGPYVVLDGSGGALSIGAFCSVAVAVHIYTHDTIGWALSAGRLGPRTAPVAIGNCTYLGPQSIIAAGTTIGTRCVVAANSVVNCDVPDGTVVGGSPARQLGKVEMDGDEPVLHFDSGQRTFLMREGEQRYG
ncbi:MAG: acyltransferase [Gammaproteobacteria bacterium]|nr:acyltransferase [Gammaproteobacteria bacterium]